MKTAKPKIILGPNNCVSNDPCALCGQRCDPCGLDYMLDGTRSLVCRDCAVKHAPDLVRAFEGLLGALAAGTKAGRV